MPPAGDVAEEDGIPMRRIMVEQATAERGPFQPKSKVGAFGEIAKKSRSTLAGVLIKIVINTRFGRCVSYNIAPYSWWGAFYVVIERIPPAL